MAAVCLDESGYYIPTEVKLAICCKFLIFLVFSLCDNFCVALETKILRYISTTLTCDKTAGKLYVKCIKQI